MKLLMKGMPPRKKNLKMLTMLIVHESEHIRGTGAFKRLEERILSHSP